MAHSVDAQPGGRCDMRLAFLDNQRLYTHAIPHLR